MHVREVDLFWSGSSSLQKFSQDVFKSFCNGFGRFSVSTWLKSTIVWLVFPYCFIMANCQLILLPKFPKALHIQVGLLYIGPMIWTTPIWSLSFIGISYHGRCQISISSHFNLDHGQIPTAEVRYQRRGTPGSPPARASWHPRSAAGWWTWAHARRRTPPFEAHGMARGGVQRFQHIYEKRWENHVQMEFHQFSSI